MPTVSKLSPRTSLVIVVTIPRITQIWFPSRVMAGQLTSGDVRSPCASTTSKVLRWKWRMSSNQTRILLTLVVWCNSPCPRAHRDRVRRHDEMVNSLNTPPRYDRYCRPIQCIVELSTRVSEQGLYESQCFAFLWQCSLLSGQMGT